MSEFFQIQSFKYVKNFAHFFADHILGHVLLGGPMLARGSGEEHWKKVSFFQKEVVLMWHRIRAD